MRKTLSNRCWLAEDSPEFSMWALDKPESGVMGDVNCTLQVEFGGESFGFIFTVQGDKERQKLIDGLDEVATHLDELIKELINVS